MNKATMAPPTHQPPYPPYAYINMFFYSEKGVYTQVGGWVAAMGLQPL